MYPSDFAITLLILTQHQLITCHTLVYWVPLYKHD